MLYDPTVFDNLKVALENQLYDLDTIEERIHIRGRRDVMDFAVMSREFALQFVLRELPETQAELVLLTSVQDLAGEIMEDSTVEPACSLRLQFIKKMKDSSAECRKIEEALESIWEMDIQVTQTIHYVYGAPDEDSRNTIDVEFRPRLTEENMNELPLFLEHVLETLFVLHALQ